MGLMVEEMADDDRGFARTRLRLIRLHSQRPRLPFLTLFQAISQKCQNLYGKTA
jgi:hypothetical protein